MKNGKQVDQTLSRLIDSIKQSVKTVTLDGFTWYDTTDEHLEAEVKCLRVSGLVAHHPMVHALIRFERNP